MSQVSAWVSNLPEWFEHIRRQPQVREQDWQQPGGSLEEGYSRPDADAAYAGAAPSGEAAAEAGPSGGWKGPPWWTRLDDFVPVAAMRGGRDPRQFSIHFGAYTRVQVFV